MSELSASLWIYRRTSNFCLLYAEFELIKTSRSQACVDESSQKSVVQGPYPLVCECDRCVADGGVFIVTW